MERQAIPRLKTDAESSVADIDLKEQAGRTVILARDVGPRRAADLAGVISRLDATDHPALTLDLRRATAVSPLVVHALLRAWEDRGRQFGSVRVLMAPGPVTRYLEGLGLDHALDCVKPGDQAVLPMAPPDGWRAAQEATLESYRALFEAAARKDLPGVRDAARRANPLCVASGAEPEGTAFGSWCHHCPMHEQYGGCQFLIERMVNDAEQGNWEAAQLLAMTLTAELVGMRLPGE